MADSFIISPVDPNNPGATLEGLKRRRALAEALWSDQKPIQHWSDGLSNAVNRITAGWLSHRAESEDKRLRGEGNKGIAAIVDALRGGGGGSGAQTPAAPVSPPASSRPMDPVSAAGGVPMAASGGIDPTSLDLGARTLLSEAGPDGRAAVAHVMLNRARSGRYGGTNLADVVRSKNQFEPWNTPEGRAKLMSYDPNSPEYQSAVAILKQAASGQSEDPTQGATHFFAPKLQAQLGRNVPKWGQGTPLAQIGGHNFYAPEGAVAGGAPRSLAPSPQGAPPSIANGEGAPDFRSKVIAALRSTNPYEQQFAMQFVPGMMQQAMTPKEYGFTEVANRLYRTDPRAGTAEALTPEVAMKGATTDDIKEFNFAKEGGYTGNFPEFLQLKRGQGGSISTDDLKEYEVAKKQGYSGSFLEFKRAQSAQGDPDATNDLKEYAAAKKQGYTGTFVEYQKEIKGQSGDTSTTDLKEYNEAKRQGYAGTFMDYKREMKKEAYNLGEGQVRMGPDDKVVAQGPEKKPEPVKFSDVTAVRRELADLPGTKRFMMTAPIFNSLVDSVDKNTRAADLNFVYGMAQIFDPTSVVREAEQVLAKSIENLPDRLVTNVRSVLQGTGALSPEVRRELLETLRSRVGSYQSSAKIEADTYDAIARRGNINPADIMPPPIELRDPGALPAGAPPVGGPPPQTPQIPTPQLAPRGAPNDLGGSQQQSPGMIRQPSPQAIELLKTSPTPEMRQQFDARYGPGMAEHVLGAR